MVLASVKGVEHGLGLCEGCWAGSWPLWRVLSWVLASVKRLLVLASVKVVELSCSWSWPLWRLLVLATVKVAGLGLCEVSWAWSWPLWTVLSMVLASVKGVDLVLASVKELSCPPALLLHLPLPQCLQSRCRVCCSAKASTARWLWAPQREGGQGRWWAMQFLILMHCGI